MSVDKSFLLQKQVKDNSEDLQSEFLDLSNWEAQMKRKDQELRSQNVDQVLPPIRNKKKKTTQKPTTSKAEKCSTNKKKIKSSDYSSWDKFDVEKACEELDETDSVEESEEELTKEELTSKYDTAMEHKEKGNIFVQQKEWDKAIGCYSEAIKIFPFSAVFYANRALCHLKQDNLHSAEADCSSAIQLDSTYVKAYHRRATARMELKQYKEAKEDLKAILKLESSNKEAQIMLAEVDKKLKAAKPIILTEEVETKEIPIEKKIGMKICDSNDKINKKKNKKINKKVNNKEIEKDIENKEIEKNIENKTTKNKNKYMPIPNWLPEKDNVAIVEPIKKPPHLQSKKQMKRIEVQDAEFEIIKCKKENNQVSNAKDIQQIKQSNIVDNKIIDEKNTLNQSCKIEEVEIDIPSVPKTAVQFLMDWRRNKSSKYHYQYLKQLPLNSLPNIFQDSMESDIFSEILNTLKVEFIPRKEQVYHYIKDLTKVKRFRALIMFISNAEKQDVKVLLEYCKNIENKPPEEVEELYKIYEI